MKQYPIILSIAGSDCSGGAGIQADIKAISALGGYAASVITAVTVQNTIEVQAVHTIPVKIIGDQIEAVMNDLHPDAIKIGMVSNKETVQTIVEKILKYKPKHIVYDPVMVSTSGKKLMTDETIEEIKRELFPLVSLITPNLDEARVLTGKFIGSPGEMLQAAKELSETYQTSILIKGGHLEGEEMQDVLFSKEKAYIYKEEKIDSNNLHGTGCTLSSSIATYLALGFRMDDAVGNAKTYTHRAIAAGKDIVIGKGNGPLCHFWKPVAAIITESDQ